MCLGERASQESHHLFEGFVKLRLSIDKPLFFARLQFDREKDSSAEHPRGPLILNSIASCIVRPHRPWRNSSKGSVDAVQTPSFPGQRRSRTLHSGLPQRPQSLSCKRLGDHSRRSRRLRRGPARRARSTKLSQPSARKRGLAGAGTHMRGRGHPPRASNLSLMPARGYPGEGEGISGGEWGTSMKEEQLVFPVVPGERAKKAKGNDLDFEARRQGQHFCPECGQDAAHAIFSNYQVCEQVQLRLRNDRSRLFRVEAQKEPGTNLKQPKSMREGGGGSWCAVGVHRQQWCLQSCHIPLVAGQGEVFCTPCRVCLCRAARSSSLARRLDPIDTGLAQTASRGGTLEASSFLANLILLSVMLRIRRVFSDARRIVWGITSVEIGTQKKAGFDTIAMNTPIEIQG